MPAKRRRERTRHISYEHNGRVLCKLQCGADFEFMDPSLGPDEIALRDNSAALAELEAIWADAWEQVGHLVVEWHILGHEQGSGFSGRPREANPGSRPWGYWVYSNELPDPRPRFREDRRVKDGRWVRKSRGYEVCEVDTWEIEFSYLQRHGLLLPDELEQYQALHKERP